MFGEAGHEIQGQCLADSLTDRGTSCEISLFETEGETLRYAKEKGISKVYLVGAQTREIDLKGGEL